MNILDLLAVAREGDPGAPAAGKPAIECGAPGGEPRELSYAALAAAVEQMAGMLRERGMTRGDRLALFSGNRPEMAIGFLAAARLGAVAVPINLAYRRREIAHILDDARPRLVLTEEAARESLGELAAAELAGAEVVTFEELASRDAAVPLPLETPAPGASTITPASIVAGEPPVAGDALALLLYTSGTTGQSKGAMITHNNLLATATGLHAAWGWRREDVLLLALPLFHVHGLVVGLLTALAAGATVRLRRRFDAAETLAELAAGATVFFGVPTMYVRLLAEIERRGGSCPLPGVRLFCSGSAPLAAETWERFAAATGHRILERYGMTEAGMILSNPYAGDRVAGQVGRPLPGVSVRLVSPADPAGEALSAGTEGELLVRGSNVFAGYWRAPEKTAESFFVDRDGERWLRTGDLAREDPASGAFTLLGRRQELILCGGFNVYPRELEEVLSALPGVREAAVIGVADAEWGEVPVAFLAADPPLDETGLLAACKRQLAGFKVPRAFHLVPALPRNALGKVQKHLLRAEAAAPRAQPSSAGSERPPGAAR